MMEWQSPQFLYFILPLCVGWLLLALYSRHKRWMAREAFAARAMWERLFPDESTARFWFKLILRELAIVASLVALAGPRFGTEVEEVVPRGSDLYVLIDVSRSMLAEDVPPSRLARAKTDVLALLNRMNGERVGLIAFAGQAVVKCPLTVDYDSFRRALQELDPNSAPRGGTAIGDAIRKALEVFHAKVDRDQSILLITDGDDQKSYPLEAAEIAAERKVAIFAVGLGDSGQGARIPDKGNVGSYVEYEGKQIWSKLDGTLLSELALKTKGVYIPAGTKSYDLAELYTDHLQMLRSGDGETQQRVRRSEQFQWFLGLVLLALAIDYCVAPYRRVSGDSSEGIPSSLSKAASILLFASAVINWASNISLAEDTESKTNPSSNLKPSAVVREGLKLYSQEKYDEAQQKFSSAVDQLDEDNSQAIAIAAFDSACAFHRKGEFEKARENYLRAGLSQDRVLATTSHFNLGNLSAEQARTAAGEKPELLAAEKRQGVLDQLKLAVDAYRHCLELQPHHSPSRRNLELVRLWIKYYSDKWREFDRQKRRDESNLLVFLEYLIATQEGLKESVEALPNRLPSDLFAELKLAQDELIEEIPTLREKLATELKPQSEEPKQVPNTASNPNSSDQKGLEEGIRMLQSWADAAGGHMSNSSKNLALRVPDESIKSQQAAVDELDKIWDAIIPFHPLLAKELAEQTTIASTLKPNSEVPAAQAAATSEDDALTVVPKEPNAEGSEDKEGTKLAEPPLQIADDQLPQLTKDQERTLRKARMLAPKAEMELQQLEATQAPEKPATPDKPDATDPAAQAPATPQQIDPEQVKAGLRKAIELAPKAVNEMETALESLNQKHLKKASIAAEEARRILEEIQQAQPKNEQQQPDEQQQDQNKDQNKQQDQQKQNEEQKDPSKENKSDDKKDDQKKDNDKQSKSDDEKKPDEKKSPQEQNQTKQQVSQERIAEALRKVRERQKEKQERDRQIRAQILGRAPVEKDW
jgi:Ca-activated chloride channel homolog